MAETLRRYEAIASERDAIRCLIAAAFATSTSPCFAGDALYEARQGAVASAMSASR